MVITLLVYLGWQLLIDAPGSAGLFAGGLLLALVGLRDDLSELAALPRLLCHVAAVALVLYGLALPLHWLLLGVIGFVMVWHVNLFNFMDGIDGIAVSQLLLFCVGVLIVSGGVPGWLGELIWLTAGTVVLAFAAFNWPPAKIFMGDVGSGFFGLLVGFLVVALAQAEIVPFIASVILLTGFWFDASYTLCVRIVSGQRFASAHRSHLYQILAARRGHRWTTGLFVAYGLCWLLPLSALAAEFSVDPLDAGDSGTGLAAGCGAAGCLCCSKIPRRRVGRAPLKQTQRIAMEMHEPMQESRHNSDAGDEVEASPPHRSAFVEDVLNQLPRRRKQIIALLADCIALPLALWTALAIASGRVDTGQSRAGFLACLCRQRPCLRARLYRSGTVPSGGASYGQPGNVVRGQRARPLPPLPLHGRCLHGALCAAFRGRYR